MLLSLHAVLPVAAIIISLFLGVAVAGTAR